MMHEDDIEDLRLTRLLRAVRAEADPALWTRVRSRAAERPRVTGLLAWAMRPAALAASVALLIAAAGLALSLGAGTGATDDEESATLGEALMAEREDEATTAPAPTRPVDGAVRDSGGSL